MAEAIWNYQKQSINMIEIIKNDDHGILKLILRTQQYHALHQHSKHCKYVYYRLVAPENRGCGENKSMWVMRTDTFWYFKFKGKIGSEIMNLQSIWTVVPVFESIDSIKCFTSLDKFWRMILRNIRLSAYSFDSTGMPY